MAKLAQGLDVEIDRHPYFSFRPGNQTGRRISFNNRSLHRDPVGKILRAERAKSDRRVVDRMLPGTATGASTADVEPFNRSEPSVSTLEKQISPAQLGIDLENLAPAVGSGTAISQLDVLHEAIGIDVLQAS